MTRTDRSRTSPFRLSEHDVLVAAAGLVVVVVVLTLTLTARLAAGQTPPACPTENGALSAQVDAKHAKHSAARGPHDPLVVRLARVKATFADSDTLTSADVRAEWPKPGGYNTFWAAVLAELDVLDACRNPNPPTPTTFPRSGIGDDPTPVPNDEPVMECFRHNGVTHCHLLGGPAQQNDCAVTAAQVNAAAAGSWRAGLYEHDVTLDDCELHRTGGLRPAAAGVPDSLVLIDVWRALRTADITFDYCWLPDRCRRISP